MVWLHVLSSVAWMSQALGLIALLAVGLPGPSAAATSMAHRLDTLLLAPMANAAAFTGLLLAGATAWGFFRHWWVLVKFVLTIAQLYAGIFLLSPALGDLASSPRAVPWQLIAGTAVMVGGLAFQVWVSIAKPWSKTPWSPARRPETAPRWVFVLGVAAPVVDTTAGLLLGYPLPALSLVMLIVLLSGRRPRLVAA